MAGGPRIIVVGAGILGLATAYHILQSHHNLDLLVIDRLGGPGRGNTARSAAAYRDMFSSPLNRALAQGSIAFYEQLQAATDIGLKRLGYLWLKTSEQMEQSRQVLDAMTQGGVKFETLEQKELSRRLPLMRTGASAQGILGRNCGILNPNLLCRLYEQRLLALGGRVLYGVEVTGFAIDGQGRIGGVRVGEGETILGTVVVATGAWINLTLQLAGLEIPVVPRKRQLFAVAAKTGPLHHLLHTRSFNPYDLLPFTIMPGGAYLRPASGSLLLGFANEDEPPGLEEPPAAGLDFFLDRIRPQVEEYFPCFRDVQPEQAWAGHYADYLADSHPAVDRIRGLIVVGGDSGSGIMKADALGRVTAGLYFGQDRVELADGRPFQVSGLKLGNRQLHPEELII